MFKTSQKSKCLSLQGIQTHDHVQAQQTQCAVTVRHWPDRETDSSVNWLKTLSHGPRGHWAILTCIGLHWITEKTEGARKRSICVGERIKASTFA